MGPKGCKPWCRWTESNRRPSHYECAALPTELHRRERAAHYRGPSITVRRDKCTHAPCDLPAHPEAPPPATQGADVTRAIVFHGEAAYDAAPATCDATVHVNTPLTSDTAGNVFFGFTATGANPLGLQGGMTRLGADGSRRWVSAAAAAGDTAMAKTASNSAPALSNDEATLYVVVNEAPGGQRPAGRLLALDAATLATRVSVALLDPLLGVPAWVSDNATSSPTVGADGDVFIGVLEATRPRTAFAAGCCILTPRWRWRARRAALAGTAPPPSCRARWCRSTPAVPLPARAQVQQLWRRRPRRRPASIVDPHDNQPGRFSSATVMRELLTVLGPIAAPYHPGGRKEWCINTATVDPLTRSVLMNSEDGSLYRWHLPSNTLAERTAAPGARRALLPVAAPPSARRWLAHSLSYPIDTLRSIGSRPGPLPERTMNQAMYPATSQTELALPSDAHAHADDTGFGIGWDHAHHGLVPPPELLLEGTPIGQGWRAGRAVFSGRSRPWPAGRFVRQWLALRIAAWREGVPLDLATVTPNHLAQIDVRACPVRRVPLGGATGTAHTANAADAKHATHADAATYAAQTANAAQVVRLNPQAAYAAGNLAVLSRAAARAWQGLGVADLVRRARAAEAAEALEHACADGAVDALDAVAWWRLATLRSLATPLPAAEAARLPLAALPPNRVRVLNAGQALQVLLTLRLAHTDWCARIGAVSAMLPAHSLRTDFNLWVGALAPRLLEAQAQGRDLARALEDAWLGERVLRRWQHFVSSLGELACEPLVRRLAAQRLPGRATELLPWDQATDGWALAQWGATAPVLSAKSPAPASGPRAPESPGGAPPAGHRRTARTPFAPRARATAVPRPATR